MPLRRIHDDATLEGNRHRHKLAFWRARPTNEIVASLLPGRHGEENPDALKVKPDGRIMDGNTRIKVLEERGYPIETLPRETV